MFPPRAIRTFVLALSLGSVGGALGCRNKPPPEEPDASGASSSSEPSADGSSEPLSDFVSGDAGNRFRDADPKVDIDPDGPIAPMCTGTEISFATTAVHPRCAIGSGRAKQLRAALERDGGPLTLKQDAKMAADGRIALRLINSGTAPLTLPLSYSSKLPAFTVLAEDERHAIYELEAPRLETGADGGSGGDGRPHFARIVLPPGGAVVATLSVNPAVVRMISAMPRSAEKCADGGPCAQVPATLAKGRYVLHVGELLTDVEAGAPARVTWDLR